MITLGVAQARIMRVLWERGEATAREITDALQTERPTAHSTVQTLLRQLLAKGAVTHESRGRTFVFRPLVAESEVGRSAARALLERAFGGSISGLMAQLLEDDQPSHQEIARLRHLIDEHDRKERP
ncbi:BlaI/MecI/CopY family transcriptional regulator [soil metagenome]